AYTALPPGTKFSVDQTGELLAIIDLARRLQPPLARAYTLLGNLWLQSELTPGPSDLAELQEGIELFPGDTNISFRAALIHTELDQLERALEIVDIGLQNCRSPEDFDKFYQLQDSILDQLADEADE
ncbi:hypothetical protein N9Z12_06185, partial [Opitutaceae bacterium]|nr:hypothetical protein [Opitutaceae bacterium]